MIYYTVKTKFRALTIFKIPTALTVNTYSQKITINTVIALNKAKPYSRATLYSVPTKFTNWKLETLQYW